MLKQLLIDSDDIHLLKDCLKHLKEYEYLYTFKGQEIKEPERLYSNIVDLEILIQELENEWERY